MTTSCGAVVRGVPAAGPRPAGFGMDMGHRVGVASAWVRLAGGAGYADASLVRLLETMDSC
jgi:hypothetical protein